MKIIHSFATSTLFEKRTRKKITNYRKTLHMMLIAQSKKGYLKNQHINQ